MENENIEIIESEEILNEENIGDMEEVLEYSGASGESSSNYSDLSVTDISIEQSDKSLEDLLKEYFSENGVMANGSSENSASGSSNDNSNDSISNIDYTDLINELIINTQDQAALESSLLSYYEEYEQNNSLDSPVNSISLTNFLLFVVFVGVLFSSTIFFARRFD